MINRHHVHVTVPDKSAELPPELPAGTRVRLTPTRVTGTVVRAEQDRGGLYVVVHVEGNGALRCIPPDRLTPVQRKRRRRPLKNEPARR